MILPGQDLRGESTPAPKGTTLLEGLAGRGRLEVVPGASHLFPEPGALERVAELAVAWFLVHLAGELASEQATS